MCKQVLLVNNIKLMASSFLNIYKRHKFKLPFIFWPFIIVNVVTFVASGYLTINIVFKRKIAIKNLIPTMIFKNF